MGQTNYLDIYCLIVIHTIKLNNKYSQYEGFDDKQWCSTATDRSGAHIADIGEWGECPDTCNTCTAVSGPGAGAVCVFPFTWNSVTHDSCATWEWGGEGEGLLWCSTLTDTWGNHVAGEGNYGFCSDTCPVEISAFVSCQT